MKKIEIDFLILLKNLNVLSKKLAESSEPLKNLIDDTSKTMRTFDRELQNLGRSTEKTLVKVDSAADDIANYLKRNKVALDTLTQSGSYELLQTLNETRSMVTTATRFFEKLDENPRSLLFDSQRKGVSVPQR